jgi:GTP-binding protein
MTGGNEESGRAIEAGRIAFARPWRFTTAASSVASLPPPGAAEVAFAGRSNVGKSSLINALTGQKGLARTSNTPGRTRELNFFTADDGVVIVDLPGYGYARAPKRAVKDWTRLVFDFLRGRAGLRRVYLLVDARHGLKPNDREVLDLLDQAAVSYQVVLTKSDKEKPAGLVERVAETEAALARRPAAHPRVIATSAATGAGLPELRAEIAAIGGMLPTAPLENGP